MRTAVLVGFATVAVALSQNAAPSTLIRDVRVFDGARVLEHRSVLIENGKIRWIRGRDAGSPDAQVVEGAGKTLLPGLIDSHVHLPFDVEGAARQALTLGVTTQLDMASFGEVLKRLKK